MRFERPTLNASVISRSPAPRAWPDIVFRILVILVLATVPCVASALHSEARRAKERVARTVSRANRMGTPILYAVWAGWALPDRRGPHGGGSETGEGSSVGVLVRHTPPAITGLAVSHPRVTRRL
jgi:hypothetical protein